MLCAFPAYVLAQLNSGRKSSCDAKIGNRGTNYDYHDHERVVSKAPSPAPIGASGKESWLGPNSEAKAITRSISALCCLWLGLTQTTSSIPHKNGRK